MDDVFVFTVGVAVLALSRVRPPLPEDDSVSSESGGVRGCRRDDYTAVTDLSSMVVAPLRTRDKGSYFLVRLGTRRWSFRTGPTLPSSQTSHGLSGRREAARVKLDV